MPIDLYVAPAGADRPDWYYVTDHDGLGFNGAFPWNERFMPPDEIRLEQRALSFREPVTQWRPATRDEAVCLLWAAFYGDDIFDDGVSGS